MSTIFAAILIGTLSISNANAAPPTAIQRGVQAGLLTRSEVHSLQRDLARIVAYERTARRDGRISQAEQRRLTQMRRSYDKRLSSYLNNGRRARR